LGRFPRVTHPSATLHCWSVRLACVRPAASVRSEPGSNSQIESFDSGFWLGGYSKDLCVTGTFTLNAPTLSGCPSNAAHHGDGYRNAVSPESLLDPGRRLRDASRIRQDPAACVSLSSYQLVKEQRATSNQRHQIPSRPTLTGSEDNEVPTGRSRWRTTRCRETDARIGRRSNECPAQPLS
jgi:hypothetical protein